MLRNSVNSPNTVTDTILGTHFHSQTTMRFEELQLCRTFKKSTFLNLSYLESFSAEFNAQKSLKYPYIAPFIFYEDEGDTIKIYRKYVIGKTINQILYEEGRFPINAALRYLMQIAEILRFLHENNIIAQTLSADNVILTDTGNICLVDFGLSAISAEYLDRPTSIKHFAMIGPDERQKTHEQDVFHLGLLAYIMIVGHFPINVASLPRIVRDFKNNNIPFEFAIDEGVESFLRRLLDNDPMKRMKIEEVTPVILSTIKSRVESPRINASASYSANLMKKSPLATNIPVSTSILIRHTPKKKVVCPRLRSSSVSGANFTPNNV